VETRGSLKGFLCRAYPIPSFWDPLKLVNSSTRGNFSFFGFPLGVVRLVGFGGWLGLYGGGVGWWVVCMKPVMVVVYATSGGFGFWGRRMLLRRAHRLRKSEAVGFALVWSLGQTSSGFVSRGVASGPVGLQEYSEA